MEIEFLTSIAVIAPDPPRSRQLYIDTLGLPLDDDGGSGYFHSDQVAGTRHFGVWPLSHAARACFGEEEWPADVPVPQVSIEFEVTDLDALAIASEELVAAGHQLLHPPREEPWGQTVARLLSPEGAVVGISFAPMMH